MKQDELMKIYNDDIIRIRRDFHQYPELGFEEVETTKRIAALLGKWGIPYTINPEKQSGKADRTGCKNFWCPSRKSSGPEG